VNVTPFLVSSSALLDCDNASITLPLDRYAMTLREAQIVDAAGSVEFARCVSHSDTPPTEAINEAERYINTAPMIFTHWLYGRWDAPYVAKYGLIGLADAPLSWANADKKTNDACNKQLTKDGLVTISNGVITDSQSILITSLSDDAHGRTMVDPKTQILRDQWRDCVAKAGYTIDTSENTSAAADDASWSPEQDQQSLVTEAQCADAMNYTQQVADINAGYQMDAVRANEAELSQTRAIADQRVAHATQILHDAGIM
jgi:hypothetical protein